MKRAEAGSMVLAFPRKVERLTEDQLRAFRTRLGLTDEPELFVIHGRNERLREGLFDYLRAIRLEPMDFPVVLSEQASGSPATERVLDAALENDPVVIVQMTPDEYVHLVGECAEGDIEPGFQSRPNVIYEAGMARAKVGERMVIVEFGRLRPISDLAGLHTVRFTGNPHRDLLARQDLLQRLQNLGCGARPDGDWLTAGDLTPPFMGQAQPTQRPRRFGRRARRSGVPAVA